MRILLHSTDLTEIESLRLLLEGHGIPVFVGSENSAAATGAVIANKMTLWVCLDHQLDDARALLKDPSHTVAAPVDVAAFHQRASARQQQLSARTFYWVVQVLLGIVLALILISTLAHD